MAREICDYLRFDKGSRGEPCNVVLTIGLMSPAPGVEHHSGDVGLDESLVHLIQAKRALVPFSVQAHVSDTKCANLPVVFEPSPYWLGDSAGGNVMQSLVRLKMALILSKASSLFLRRISLLVQ